jgi:hypothetical protein
VSACRTLLQREELLGAEGLVVDLGGGFNEVLKMGTGQEVAQVDEFAVVLVLNYEAVRLELQVEAND